MHPPAHRLRNEVRNRALVLTSKGLHLSHFNSVIGLGIAAPATEAEIEQTIGTFRLAPALGYVVNIAAGAQPPDLEKRLLSRGPRPAGAWERVARGSEPPSAALPNHSPADAVTRHNASQWSRFIDRVYGLNNEPWLLALVGRQGWRHYMVREGDEVAAARSMYTSPRRCAWLDIDAPIPGLMTGRFDRVLHGH